MCVMCIECVCVSVVCVWGGVCDEEEEQEEEREEGGRKEGADTELKTKTPHVNAGKKLKILFESLVG